MSTYLRYLFFVIAFVNTPVFAQHNFPVTGKVVDEKGNPIQLATILLHPSQHHAKSDETGSFTINLPINLKNKPTQLPWELRVNFVGKKSYSKKYDWEELQKPIIIILKDNSLTLEEVEIIPTIRQSDKSISSIIFNEEAIERAQAFSLMDILNTLPGKQAVAPNINSPQTLTLRNTLQGSHNLNNSLGIPIIIDGIYQSNDANMQARPASQRGMGSAALPAVTSGNTADVPFQGIDLREISVEAIEKIEVIQGVASAEYGELTDGAIVIERKAGHTPWHLTTNINGGSSNFSLNKGFDLPKKWGGLTGDLNYALSHSDPRDKVQEYKRYGASIRWNTSRFSIFRNKLSLDYNWKNDQAKRDPDDASERTYQSNQHQFRLSNSLNAKLESRYIQSIDFNFSYAEGKQNSYSQWRINQANKGYSVKDTTGIYEGTILNGQYLAVEQIIGNPISGQASLRMHSEFQSNRTWHQLSYGVDANYSNNGGKGIISDPERPRFVNFNNQNIRPYSFELTPSMINTGAYISDRIRFQILNKKASANLGLRLGNQNGSWSWQPRLQSNVEFNKQWNVGFAYGVSTKSPTLLHRNPLPVWIDIPLILAYNSNASLYLVYTEKFEKQNQKLKPIRSNQAEITINHSNTWFSSYINAFYKNTRDGYHSISEYQKIVLPNYGYEYNRETKQIDYWQTGTFTNYIDKSYYTIKNLVGSDTYGVDWSFQFKKIKSLQTQVNFSTSYIWSAEKNPYLEATLLNSPVKINGENIWHGLYEPRSNQKSFRMTSNLGTITHISNLGFVLMTNTDIFWLNQRLSQYKDLNQIAKGYLNTEMQQVLFNVGEGNTFPKRNLQESTNVEQFIYANFSVSVAKEIGKKIRIAITAYNAFNLRPEHSYTNPDTGIEITKTYNQPLSITGGISFKL